MKPTVYIESSIISYLTARPSRDVVIAARQAVTCDWWDNHRHRFDLFISELVEEDISRGDAEAAELRIQMVAGIENLLISTEVENLAELLVAKGAVPSGSEEDALHIAVASDQGIGSRGGFFADVEF